MADITKCANKNCEIKELCYRHNAPDSYWQSYANFNNNKIIKDKKECKEFYPYNKKEGGKE